jgi:hypothetical protein
MVKQIRRHAVKVGDPVAIVIRDRRLDATAAEVDYKRRPGRCAEHLDMREPPGRRATLSVDDHSPSALLSALHARMIMHAPDLAALKGRQLPDLLMLSLLGRSGRRP